MAISISRYVSVNSAVLGAAIVSTRQLILNMFTVNPLIPPKTYITFTSAAEVGQYFGTSSEEFYRASKGYFDFTSKDNNTPALMQFTRWVNTAVAAAIFGYGATTALASWNAITNGSLGLTIGAYTSQITGLDFSSATSLGAAAFTLAGTTTSSSTTVTMASTAGLYVGMPVVGTGIPVNTTVVSFIADTSMVISNAATASGSPTLTFLPSVAAILQNAIRAISGGGADWTAATVTYGSNNFQLVGGVVGDEDIAVQAGGTGTDISGSTAGTNLGWFHQASTSGGVFIPGAIWSPGSAIETITETLTNAANANNNFGSFGFCYSGINGSGVNGTGLSLVQYQEAAIWNNSLVPNVQFKLDVPVVAANASNWASAYDGGLGGLGEIGGVNLTLTDYAIPLSINTQYPEQCDAAIEAATNYDGENSVQNYMYQVFPLLRALVTTDSDANAYDNLSINYIGQTQNAGQLISFYQRGLLQGAATQPLDSGIYANEQWLKSAVTAQIMNLLLASNYVPANNQGVSMVTGVMQSVIQQALTNGTISVGKTLTALQRADITSVTGNALAWQQVQNVGYYLTVVIEAIPNSNPTQYQARYTLVYSKNDVIRFVQGTDDLI